MTGHEYACKAQQLMRCALKVLAEKLSQHFEQA